VQTESRERWLPHKALRVRVQLSGGDVPPAHPAIVDVEVAVATGLHALVDHRVRE
jgi:hypothetical protein